MLEARRLDQFEQERGTLSKPVKCFGTDFATAAAVDQPAQVLEKAGTPVDLVQS